ncbi:MAG: SUMF1/EgtB/PvdO family nonheme iron enzyme [Spirochaetes bacterium]|nr:SUMF1/EgtB/PvdO family nonheme iron enzyme [Spirochaetota bacterium]
MIGISADTMEKAFHALKDPAVKKEYIAGSFPQYGTSLETVYIRKFLTSCGEFALFIKDTGYLTEGEREGWGWVWREERWQKESKVTWLCPFGTIDDEQYRHDDGPVMQVSWNDDAAYCSWLTAKAGFTVRLPHEAEWEVFARMGGVPGMEEWADGLVRVDGQVYVSEYIKRGEKPVDGDPAGLIWEWTEDWYKAYPGGKELRDYGTVYKVLRGGSHMSLPVQRTREFRLRKCPTARSPYYGFRIACVAPW